MKYYEFGAVVLGLVAGTVQGDPVQWSAADGGNGHWYEAVLVDESDAGSWEVYRDYANAMGGHLATLSTEEENAWVKNNIANDPALWENQGGCVCLGPYIGAYREADDDQWTWIDGSEWAFTDWHPGNPDGPPAPSSCILLFDLYGNNNGYAWQDTSFSGTKINSYSFIVEWPTQPPVQWRIQDGGNGHWYQAIEDPGILWENANTTAISMGGYLATPTSAEENQFIYEMIEPIDSMWNGGQWNGPWLGGYQDTNAPDYVEPMGGWRWATEEVWNFTNWASNQPDDGGTPFTENHLQYWVRDQNTWNDIHTAANISGFVVEFTTLPGSALGACCLDGLCITTAAADCSGNSGSWGGPNSSCTDFDCPVSCPGDLNGDGQVDVTDLLLIISAWGICP